MSLVSRLSFSRTPRLLALTALLAWLTLWLGTASDLPAQDERGEGVEFPFRDEDGTLRWLARADEVEAEPRRSFPLAPGRRALAYRFDTAGNRMPDEDGIARGVSFVMPFDEPSDAPQARRGRFARGQRLARLDAARAAFYPGYRLISLEQVHLRLNLGDAGEAPESRANDEATAETAAPAQLRTPRLYVAFEPHRLTGTDWHTEEDPESALGARIFTDDSLSLHVPQQNLWIREARGLDMREGDPAGRVRFDGRVRGVIAGADWLGFGAAPRRRNASETTDSGVPADPFAAAQNNPEVVQFHCEGSCIIELGAQFRERPQRVSMRRGVFLRQAAQGRELVCDRLWLDLTGPGGESDADEAATRSPLREVIAEENVRLEVAGSLRARGNRFAFAFEHDEDGTERQRGTLDGVEAIRLYTEERDPISPGGLGDEVPHGRAMIEGFAEGRVEVVRELHGQPQATGLSGEEQWTLHQFARLERWVAVGGEHSSGAASQSEREPLRPDFGVPRREREAQRRAEREAAEPLPVPERLEPERHLRDGYRLVHAINGSGVRRLAGDDEVQHAPSGELIGPRIDPERRGRITIRFRLHEPSSPRRSYPDVPEDGTGSRAREPVREFKHAEVDNPGARPIVEMVEQGPFGMRFFADHLELKRDYDAARATETLTSIFRAERPQITWITREDRFGLWPVAAPEGAVYRYSLTGDGQVRFEERRHDEESVPQQRHLRAPGRVAMRKAPYQGFGSYDERRLIEWDCRDLELDFDNRFGEGLELNALRAAATAEGPMRLKMGRDLLYCKRLDFRREPQDPAQPQPVVAGNPQPGEPRVPWQETLTLTGPVKLELRDPRSSTLLPIRGPREELLTPALTRLESEERLWVRTELARRSEQEALPTRREVELRGPFGLQAFGDDPDRLPADVAPQLLARMSGEYLDMELGPGETPGQLERMVAALAAGEIELDYRSRGLSLTGQRVDYRSRAGAGNNTANGKAPAGTEGEDSARSRLRVIGEPHLQIQPTGESAPRGRFEIAFPQTSTAARRARQRVELLGEPWHIRVHPRGTLNWHPQEEGIEPGNAEALQLTANEILGVLHPVDEDGSLVLDTPREAQTIMRLFEGGGVTVSQLRGEGGVHLRTGPREALGETFLWRRHDGHYAYLWGEEALVRDVSPAGLRFELLAEESRRERSRRHGSLPRISPWLPDSTDPAEPAPQGTTFRYRHRDPEHPERRDIIDGTNPERHLHLKLRLPEAIRRTAQAFLPPPEATDEQDELDDLDERLTPEPAPHEEEDGIEEDDLEDFDDS